MAIMFPAIKERSGGGAECFVYETSDKNVLFKKYCGETYNTVRGIAKTQQQYAKKGLAPDVLSRVIEQNGNYGFYVERVDTPFFDIGDDDINELADKMNIDEDDRGELEHNMGIKNGKPVLVDFGGLTLYLLGLKDHPSLKK